MTRFYFAAVETEAGCRAELKIATPHCMAADVFDPCSTFAEFEARLDAVGQEIERAREDARCWFERHQGGAH